MKIAIAVGGLPPIYNGGTEVATTKIAAAAANLGHDVHVIAADMSHKGKQSYVECEKGFTVHHIGVPHTKYGRDAAFMLQTFYYINKLKPDIVHAQALYMCPAPWLASKFGYGYIFYERGSVYQDWRFKAKQYNLFMKSAKRVIAQTDHQRLELLKYCDREIEIIPNGVDIDRFGLLSKQDARIKLGLPLSGNIVLAVGRCRKEKNLSCFVDAALLDKTDTMYLVAGDGPQLEMLKSMAGGRVRFLGLVQNELIPAYLAAADVLVNTSLSEGFPVAVLEGFAAGIPVVAPRICGIPEIVKDMVNGMLTEPTNPQSTHESIRYVLDNECLARSMSESNRRKAKEFTWENVARKLYG